MYDKTRESWEDIWSKASVEAEIEVYKEPRASEAFNYYLPYLSKNGLILEAGCGLGPVLLKLRKMGYQVLGMDYAAQALHTLHDYDPTLDTQVGDVHALPYRDGSLHGYLSFGVLEHFAHGMGPALHEASRVLAPGGILVLTIPYPNVIHNLVQFKRRLLKQHELTDEDFYESTYTQHDLKREAEQAGFEVLLVKPTGHSYTLWGLGGPFRQKGYYKTSRLADMLGSVLRVILPWPFNFTTLIIGRKK
jgi:SAM-dependent methyltransferase